MNPRLRRRLRRLAGWAAVAFVLVVLLSNRWVINSTDGLLYKDSSLLPDNEVGLVLGCSPFASGGSPNPQFHGRMQAAAELYRLGKVSVADAAGPWVLFARLAQSTVHLIGVNHWLVFIRANFLLVQAALFAWMIWGLLQ